MTVCHVPNATYEAQPCDSESSERENDVESSSVAGRVTKWSSNPVFFVKRVFGIQDEDEKLTQSLHTYGLKFKDAELEKCYRRFIYLTATRSDLQVMVWYLVVAVSYTIYLLFFSDPPPSLKLRVQFISISTLQVLATFGGILAFRSPKTLLYRGHIMSALLTFNCCTSVLLDGLSKHSWIERGFKDLYKFDGAIQIAIIFAIAFASAVMVVSIPTLVVCTIIVVITFITINNTAIRLATPSLRFCAYGFLYFYSAWLQERSRRKNFFYLYLGSEKVKEFLGGGIGRARYGHLWVEYVHEIVTHIDTFK
eukprot:Colp12_sorted_trinity150504_noHs@25666